MNALDSDRRSIDSWEGCLDLFECYKHDDVPATDAHEVGRESLIEGKRTLVLHNTNEQTWNAAGFSGSSIHDASFEHVDGRADHDCD